MRDSMLSVAGELDLTMGGRPIDLQATLFPSTQCLCFCESRYCLELRKHV